MVTVRDLLVSRLALLLRQGGMGILAGLSLLPVGVTAKEAGDLDTTFGVEGKVITDFGDSDLGRAIALQHDGKIVVVGNAGPLIDANDNVRSFAKFALARYLPNGRLDTTFGGDGRVTTAFEQSGNEGPAQAVAVQSDGKIVAAGYTPSSIVGVDFALARYLPDGSLDASFGDDGKVTTDIRALLGLPGANARASAIVLQPDGRIVAIGGNFFVRYLADGSLDASFGEGGLTTIRQRPREGAFELFAAALQHDGKIVAVGRVNNLSSSAFVESFALARVLPDGTFDTSFGIDGLVKTDVALNASLAAVALQPDGKIVAAGRTVVATGDPNTLTSNFAVARYLRDGVLDTTFGSGGLATADFAGSSQARGVTLQPDGKIVAAGDAVAGLPAQGTDFALARYLQNGTLDTTFGNHGLVTTDFGEAGRLTFATGLVIQPDGHLVLAGAALTGVADFPDFDFALARYESGLVSRRGPPTHKEDCKHGGWRTFNIPRHFKSQGDCIQFVNTGK